jgi:hypothetical protein
MGFIWPWSCYKSGRQMQKFSLLGLQVSRDWVGYSGFTVHFKTQGCDAKALKWKVKCTHQNQERKYTGKGELVKINQGQCLERWLSGSSGLAPA